MTESTRSSEEQAPTPETETYTDPLLQELQWRGLLYQTAGSELEKHLATPGRVGYCGWDPTSTSLTIGNYIPMKVMMHFQRAGHRPIIVVGGGTGLIGDPSGKDSERQLQTREQVEENVAGIRRIFERLFDFDDASPNSAIFVNNVEWLENLGYLEVLRDVGKHFSVNVMIQKDSVRERLHNRDQGISYTEFSYMVLQAYDFLHLRRTHECTLQLAGSDQYGNIVAGMDLIRRAYAEEGGDAGQAYGITAPLVMGTDGKKIGKTEKGAVWLTADRTSAYAFYQYWINVADDDVIQFLKWFTFLDRETITEIESQHDAARHQRLAQRTLAEEMTRLFHGDEELTRVQGATAALFGQGSIRDLDDAILDEVFAEVPRTSHPLDSLAGEGLALVDFLPETSLAKSKREAREFLGNNAVAVNGERVPAEYQLTEKDLLHGRTILLKRGKKNWHATQWS